MDTGQDGKRPMHPDMHKALARALVKTGIEHSDLSMVRNGKEMQTWSLPPVQPTPAPAVMRPAVAPATGPQPTQSPPSL